MKQSSTSVVVMSDAERRERLRNRIYAVFPVVSVLLLILLWFLAAGAPFPLLWIFGIDSCC